MNNELKSQIDSMIDNYCSEFIDTYLYTDCDITIKQFVAYVIEHFSTEMQKYIISLINMEDNEEYMNVVMELEKG